MIELVIIYTERLLYNGAEARKKGSLKRREGLSDDNSELAPPDTMPNSEVKQFSADGSVGFPHVRVGHRQALI